MAIDADFLAAIRAQTEVRQQNALALQAQSFTNPSLQADARLTNTRATLLPAESAAGIGKTKAETGLIGKSTEFYAQEARARIAQLYGAANSDNANASATRVSGVNATEASPEAIQRILDARRFQFKDLGVGLGDNLGLRQSRPAPY